LSFRPGLLLAPTAPLSDVERSLIPECPMSDAVSRLNAALEGRYAIERELGEGGMATVDLAEDKRLAPRQQEDTP